MSATDGQPGLAENSWGTDPTKQRQTKLEEMLHEWEMESNHGDRLGPFAGKALSGADAFWLSRCPQVWHGLSTRDPGAENVPHLWSCA